VGRRRDKAAVAAIEISSGRLVFAWPLGQMPQPRDQNFRMQPPAKPTIRAEMKDPDLTVAIRLVGPGVMESQGMVDGSTAGSQWTGDRVGGIDVVRRESPAGGWTVRPVKSFVYQPMRQNPTLIGAWDEPHTAVFLGCGLQRNPEMR
jgi:hypothetical protein